ncbi:MAG: EVE domain-containing protein [Candidatus Competibacterales bacterium]
MKSEPAVYGIDDLARAPGQTDRWDGIRNYQVRNWLRDVVQVGDRGLFYHSNTRPPAVVGLVTVTRGGYPDPTAFDPQDPYHDPKSDPQSPRWFAIDVQLQRYLKRPIPLGELRAAADGLGDFPLLRRGNRLSIIPVTFAQWQTILALENQAPFGVSQ